MPTLFKKDVEFITHLKLLIKEHAQWKIKTEGSKKYPAIFFGEGYALDPFQDADPPVPQDAYKHLFNSILTHFGIHTDEKSSTSPFTYEGLRTRKTSTTSDYLEVKDSSSIQSLIENDLIPPDIANQLTERLYTSSQKDGRSSSHSI